MRSLQVRVERVLVSIESFCRLPYLVGSNLIEGISGCLATGVSRGQGPHDILFVLLETGGPSVLRKQPPFFHPLDGSMGHLTPHPASQNASDEFAPQIVFGHARP